MTQDVFLTTLKPLQKVVTAQDVESCLYYVHIDSADDEQLLQPSNAQHSSHDMHFVSEQTASGKPSEVMIEKVQRKPLPPRHRPGSGDHLRDTTQGGVDIMLDMGDDPQTFRTRSETTLYGPRPMTKRPENATKDTNEYSTKTIDVFSGKWCERPPAIPPKLPLRPERADEFVLDSESMRAQKYPSLFSSDDVSFTLIRRYAGLQSNVGKVKFGGLNKPTLNGNPPTFTVLGPTIIDVYTLGYSKFAEAQTPNSSRSCTSSEIYHAPDKACHSDPGNHQNPIFQRQLYTPSSKRRPSLQHGLNDSSSALSVPDSRSGIAFRRRSQQQSTASPAIGVPSPRSSPDSPPANGKGHMFYSPWNGGVCEFTTGIAGRSLKCKHTYSPSHIINSSSAPVSELRFNLPSSSALGPRTRSSAETPKASKRSSIFSRRSRPEPDSKIATVPLQASRVELEDRLDLSLGQEHAGGGFGGKQAKLGKLIIEEEGLKMIDLVVAANMALWWKVFENS